MAEPKVKKLTVVDANVLDKKIPRNLIIKFGDNFYILKAGLEWKAMQLFGGGGYSLETEIIERKENYALVKAMFVSKDGAKYSNYGEASFKNVTNPRMQPYLLHLAITRAECRVLRMATACGYVSKEEMVGASFNESLNLPEPEKVEKIVGVKSSVDITTMRKELK